MISLDIDHYLNPLIPRPRWHVLPRALSHWFGYRAPGKDKGQPRKPQTSALLVWLFSFLGAFIGISIIENVFRSLPRLDGNPVPLVIASFGAAAILEYNTIESPLSQPRNLLLGHFLSALVGVSVTKLFHLLPEARFEELRWLAGALSVGAASSVMAMTKTVHPPAGATALLAATSPEMTDIGWWLLPLVLLASSLMLASAMLINNLYKSFPLYWWTPANLADFKSKEEAVASKDTEMGHGSHNPDSSVHSGSDASLKKDMQPRPTEAGSEAGRVSHHEGQEKVEIGPDKLVLPDGMVLGVLQLQVLEEIQAKLRSDVGRD